MWKKRDVVESAFAELGIASYNYDLRPDELQSAMRILDAIMAGWAQSGIVFDPVYPQPLTPTAGDLDDDTNAPDHANAAMYLNLAVRLAPGYGKTPSIATITAAGSGYDAVLSRYATIPTISLEGAPRGAGGKRPFSPFLSGGE